MQAKAARKVPVGVGVLPAAAACALLALGCGPGAMPASVRHPLVGGAAPEFEAESTAAATVRVPGSRRTRVTVIDFWASWCGACSRTMPALDQLWRERRADGVAVIGVNVDDSDAAADAAAHELGATFPIVVDPGQRLSGTYGVAQVPLTFVVDAAGTVRWVGRDPASVRRAVEVLLAEQPGGARRRSAFE
ncbi:disulfide isomerase [Sorangium cellulosum]|uniref:Disulfide isomerase n=1 Tax=Sorangium cellulosum TaxID=56 RepID=A0A2L0F9Q7_SORCE|nr:TlpA disulfide reductase family protein [Sorangium cellulosum]AUX48247.1 disulfide isomerase [Sorangium cellulosum]